jgi:tetratricopeptide (TPR) repeat protein/predicted Ser/Thr protein kinase
VDDLPTDRWQRLESLVHAALARPASERAAFLVGACGDDEALRREAESLVAGADSAGAFLETPAAGVSLVGRQLGAYRLEELIGAGGMGEVYRAKDPRLGRDVAVKILPAARVADPQRRARFEREARAIAALNHPNICAIYDVGQEGGLDFLVMEYVDGAPLSARLAQGPLPMDQALARATEIAEALDCAHRQGIIHRDLKPGNVMLARAGDTSRATHAKLVDFGLARMIPSPVAQSSIPPTATAPLTVSGAVLGTPQYMAPEQIEGRSADARTDVFAFGALLFEMLTGRPAFEGPSAPAIMAAILRADPPSVTALQPAVPRSLERLLQDCLAKDPADRISSMHDVLLQLRGIADELRPQAQTMGAVAGKPRPSRRFLALAGLAVTAAAIAWWMWPRPPILAARDTILIADFVNTTNDTVFDGALKQALAVSLEQSPYVSTMSEARIQAALRLMTRPAEERITRTIAQEICQRQNLKAFIAGGISPIGREYAITLEAVHGQTGDVLARELEQARSKEEVLTAVGRAASRMRERLGEPLASIRQYDVPLPIATTSSLEALRVYSIGREHFERLRYQDAIDAYRRAIDLDPDFAKAWDSLVPALGNSRRPGGQDAARRAYALRERASERERLLIEARYELIAERNLKAARAHYERFLAIYPDSDRFWANVAALHRNLGEPERAIEPATEGLRRYADNSIAATHLALALIELERTNEARQVIDTRQPGDWAARRGRFVIAYMEQDAGSMTRIADAAAAEPDFRHLVLALQSEAAGFEGRTRDALSIAQRSADAARQGGFNGAEAFAETALRDAAFEACAPARAEAGRALASSGNSMEAALAMSWCGNLEAASGVVTAIREQFPNGTLEHGLWIPLIEAAGAFAHEPDRALSLLDAAKSLERSNRAVFRPQYLRGLTYLRLRRPTEAAAEFQRILDHRGLAPISPLYPLAHVGLARAAAMQGDQAKARQAYETFFSIWKDADADVPILVAARKEYAALK